MAALITCRDLSAPTIDRIARALGRGPTGGTYIQFFKILGASGKNARPHIDEIIEHLGNYPAALDALASLRDHLTPHHLSEIASLLVEPKKQTAARDLLRLLGESSKRHFAAALEQLQTQLHVGNLPDSFEHLALIPPLLDDVDDNLIRATAEQAILNFGSRVVGEIENLPTNLSLYEQVAILCLLSESLTSLDGKTRHLEDRLISCIFDVLRRCDDLSLLPETVTRISNIPPHIARNTSVDSLLHFMTSDNIYLRLVATVLLTHHKDLSASHLEQVVAFLQNADNLIVDRIMILESLGAQGERAIPYAPTIAVQLTHPSPQVREAAIFSLQSTCNSTNPFLFKIAETLGDEDSAVRLAAITVLSEHDKNVGLHLTKIAALIKDPSPAVAEVAIQFVGAFEEKSIPYIPALLDQAENQDSRIAIAAVWALSKLHEYDDRVVHTIASQINNKSRIGPRHLPAAAIAALGETGEKAKGHTSEIIKRLSMRGMSRGTALDVLGKIGDSATTMPLIAEYLSDEGEGIRNIALDAITNLARIDYEICVALIDRTYYYGATAYGRRYVAGLRFSAYYVGNGSSMVNDWLRWTGCSPWPEAQKDRGFLPEVVNPRQLLEHFLQMPIGSERQSIEFRMDVSEKLARIVFLAESRDLLTYDEHYRLLKRVELWIRRTLSSKRASDRFARHAKTVGDTAARLADNRTYHRVMRGGAVSLSTHIIFWLGLWLLYPHVTWIRSLFFWNRWVRRVGGLFYVGPLLVLVPPLRQRIMLPFREILLGSLHRGDLITPYYESPRLVDKVRASQVDTDLGLLTKQGPVLIEGESGVGKTMLLARHLHSNKDICVYLRAQDCGASPIEAIRSSLLGPATDEGFLESLIHNGAFTICIDGINEARASTRIAIFQFVNIFRTAKILLTTQEIGWTPPDQIRVLRLEPIRQEEVITFLKTIFLKERAKLNRNEYETRVRKFALQNSLPVNPLDLTIIGELIEDGEDPDLFRLQQQLYQKAERTYEHKYKQSFPMCSFSEYIYKMRCEGRESLSGEFPEVVDALTSNRLMLKRDVKTADQKHKDVWIFRHEKIQAFFVSQAMTSSPERLVQHIQDPGFRTTYLLLADTLPEKDALELREKLSDWAAETREHDTADAIRRAIRRRKFLDI